MIDSYFGNGGMVEPVEVGMTNEKQDDVRVLVDRSDSRCFAL